MKLEWWSIAWFSIASTGCGLLLDESSYGFADSDAGMDGATDETSARGTLFYSDSCNACLRGSCGAELDACASDERCNRLKACVDDCREPSCWVRCAQGEGVSLTNWPLKEIDDCAVSGCRDECRIGLGNLDCAGAWFLPALYSPNESFSLQVTMTAFLTAAPVSAWTITACAGSRGDCTAMVGSDETDQFGNATFELVTDRGGEGFNGFLETSEPTSPVAGGPAFTYRHRRDDLFNHFWDAPVELSVDPMRVSFGVYEAALGRPPSNDVGAILVSRSFDCHYWPMRTPEVQASAIEGPGVQRFDEVFVFGGERAEALGVADVFAVAAPPGRYEIVVSQPGTGIEYRRFEQEIQAGVFEVWPAFLPRKGSL